VCIHVNQGSATSSQEVVDITLSISYSGVKFFRAANNVRVTFFLCIPHLSSDLNYYSFDSTAKLSDFLFKILC